MAVQVWRTEGWAGIRWRLGNARGIAQGDLPSGHIERKHMPTPRMRDLVRLAIGPGGLAAHTHDENYHQWAGRYDAWDDAMRRQCRDWLDTLAHKPHMVICLTIRPDDAPRLERWIEAMQHQVYAHWSLCVEIVATASGQAPAANALARLQQRLVGAPASVFVSTTEDDAVLTATAATAAPMPSRAVLQGCGDWLLFPSLDARLHEAALARMVATIAACPQACLVYGDEDGLDAQGERQKPHFKPEWNYDLLLSTAYIGQAFAVSRKMLDRIAWPSAALAPAAWWLDVQLQCAEQIGASEAQGRIVHVPWIVLHGPLLQDAQALRGPGAPDAGRERQDWVHVLKAHWARTGGQAEAVAGPSGAIEVHYALAQPAPWVTLVVPTRNCVELLRTCITSIRQRTDYAHYDILVIDNGSDEPEALAYLEEIGQRPGVTVVRDDRPFNFSALNNRAVGLAKGELIGFINNDIEAIDAGWLTELTSTAVQPDVGAVGARLLFPDRRIQHAGVILGFGGVAGHGHKFFKGDYPGYHNRACAKQSLSAVTAACLVVRKSSFLQVGGFNEDDLAIAYNDVDLCLKLLQAGYRNVYAPQATLLHHESVSRGQEDTPEKRARFKGEQEYMLSTWQRWINADPAYSPNLTIEREDFSLAWPPRLPAQPWEANGTAAAPGRASTRHNGEPF